MISLIVVKYVYNIESDNMNRKTKIIVSITGITLVGLMLLGLTYGYFITKINGNTNAKSISVSSAKKVVEYTDLSEEISGEIIEPGYETIKVFTAKNIGDTSATYHIYLDNVVNEFIRTQDITYTLYRKAGNNTIDTSNLSDSDIVASGFLPKVSNYILLNQTIETPNDYYTYALKINYINSEENQDEDQGHTFSFKVQLHGDIVNNFEQNTLAYNILDNSMKKANGTELLSSPKTQVAVASSFISTKGTHIASRTEGFYGWDGLTYGDTQDEADGGEHAVSGADNVVKCNSVKGKHISDSAYCGNWCSYIGKVEDCTTDGTPMLAGSSENTMSVATDDYGTSYYYRGNVIDNYVNFAGMCWRAVRIVGDGSIKLILEDQDSTCATSDGNWNIPITTGGTVKKGNFGYTQHAAKTLTASDGTQNSSTKYLMNYLNGGTNKDKSMATAFKNFQTGPLANYLDKLKVGDWCLNDKAYATSNDNTTALTSQEILDKQIKGTTFYYDSNVRLNGKTTKEPTLKCNGTNMNKFADNTDMYVGTLTADEMVYAGGKVSTNNPDYYLINDYQQSNDLHFWSLSPGHFAGSYDYAFFVHYDGTVNSSYVSNVSISFRPAVTLLSSVQITGGDGTKANAYTIG